MIYTGRYVQRDRHTANNDLSDHDGAYLQIGQCNLATWGHTLSKVQTQLGHERSLNPGGGYAG